MTTYNDVPQVTMLHAEQERVTQAIEMLESGGTMPSFAIAPPPPPPYEPGTPPPMIMMPVTITVPNVIDQALRDQLLVTLNTRQAELAQQLADLGVTDVKTVG